MNVPATVDEGGPAVESRDSTIRRAVERAFAVLYLTTVPIAVILLVVIDEIVLAVWMALVEIASVTTLVVMRRRGRRAAERDAAAGIPRRTTRLGTPLDPGMPSGR
jgi:beta-lactamase regulating signal transducer with metallopeptidase domain